MESSRLSLLMVKCLGIIDLSFRFIFLSLVHHVSKIHKNLQNFENLKNICK